MNPQRTDRSPAKVAAYYLGVLLIAAGGVVFVSGLFLAWAPSAAPPPAAPAVNNAPPVGKAPPVGNTPPVRQGPPVRLATQAKDNPPAQPPLAQGPDLQAVARQGRPMMVRALQGMGLLFLGGLCLAIGRARKPQREPGYEM